MSNNLLGERVNEGQVSKEITINDGLGTLDAALTEVVAIDMSGGDVVVTPAVFTSAALFILNPTAAHNLTLPALKRHVAFLNAGTAIVTLILGTAAIPVPIGKSLAVTLDGTANGLTYSGTATIVPAGGTAGQVLTKATADDFDFKWLTPAASTGTGSGGGSSPAAGGPTVVQAAFNNTQGADGVTFATAPKQGNVLVYLDSQYSHGNTAGGWSWFNIGNSGHYYRAVYTKVCGADEPAAQSPSDQTRTCGVCFEVSGVTLNGAVFFDGGNPGGGTNSGALVGAPANALILGVFTATDDGGATFPQVSAPARIGSSPGNYAFQDTLPAGGTTPTYSATCSNTASNLSLIIAALAPAT